MAPSPQYWFIFLTHEIRDASTGTAGTEGRQGVPGGGSHRAAPNREDMAADRSREAPLMQGVSESMAGPHEPQRQVTQKPLMPRSWGEGAGGGRLLD